MEHGLQNGDVAPWEVAVGRAEQGPGEQTPPRMSFQPAAAHLASHRVQEVPQRWTASSTADAGGLSPGLCGTDPQNA